MIVTLLDIPNGIMITDSDVEDLLDEDSKDIILEDPKNQIS